LAAAAASILAVEATHHSAIGPIPAFAADPGPLSVAAADEPSDSTLVMFWNVENFFDWEDGSRSSSDAEFSSNGARRWTRHRFYKKCELIAKTVFYIAGLEGRLPDVIGLAEIENERVLNSLVASTLLRKCSYRTVTFPSPDPRGIDVGLLYNERTLRLDFARASGIWLDGGERLLSRDILIAGFVRRQGGDSLALTINHHPSKYGGAAAEPKRAAAVRQLAFIADSLKAVGWHMQAHVGDFNDTPESPVYDGLAGRMENLAVPLSAAGEGSIRFDGRWELIDQAFVSRQAGHRARMKVVPVPFLTVKDSAHSGTKPLRTYSGPRYIGGVSDHYPILVLIQ